MRVKWAVAVAGLGLILPAVPVLAHHSFGAEYDANQPVTLKGTVTKFEWTNPHAWLYVDGKDESGKVTSWSFEMGSPSGLVHRGWRSTELKTGDRVTVDGFAAKDGSNLANASTVTLPDGRKLFGGFKSTPGAPVK